MYELKKALHSFLLRCQLLKPGHVNYLKTGHLCCYRFHVILFVHFVEFHPLLTQVEGAGFRAEEWDG